MKYRGLIPLLLALLGMLFSGSALPRDWLYTVRNNDSLWKICSTYVERPLCFVELGNYNKLAEHDLIAPGSILKVPYAWLKNPPQPALVVYSRGEVQYIPAAESEKLAWEKVSRTPGMAGMVAAGISLQPLPEDGRIFMGDRVVTGDGNVRVEFADGSQMIIRPQSDVIFDRLSIQGDKRFVDTLLILKRGATTNNVEPQQGQGSRFRIRTPAGVAAVRGTEFRVNVEAGSSPVMRSEVLEGNIAVADLKAKSEQSVDGGYGVRSEAGQPIPPPRKLLAAPAWQGDTSASVAIPFSVSWQALAGADYYLIDLFDSDGLVETRRVQSTQLGFEALVDGEYRLKIRAVDEIGLQGLEAERALVVMTPLPIPELNSSSVTTVSRTTLNVSWAGIEEASALSC